MTSETNHSMPFAALAAVIAISLSALFFWSRHETRPLAWDQSIHTQNAWTYQDRLSGKSHDALFAPAEMNYPPLFHLSLMEALRVVKNPAHAGAAVNAAWMIALVLCVFGIGRKLMGAWEGAAAAAIVMCYPVVIDLLRDTMIDFSLMGWVSLAMLCLVMSESFGRPLWSVGFGLALAGGMLTKWTAFAYVAGPLAGAALLAWRRGRTGWMWLSLLIAAIVMSPWFVPNLVPMLARLPHLSSLPPASGQRLAGWESFFWYPISLFEQMTLAFVLLLAFGLLFAVWRPALFPLLAWFFGSMILFSLIHNRNIRYFMPALPAAALLSVAWFAASPRLFKRATIAVALIFSALSQFGVGRVSGFYIGPEYIPCYVPRVGVSENWRHEEIVRYLDAAPAALPGRAPRVLVLANAPYFHSVSLTMSARRFGANRAIFYGPSKRRSFEFADYVLTKTGDLGPEFTLGTINACVKVIRDPNSWFSHVYKEVRRWPLGDGSEAILYAAKPDPANISVADTFNLNLRQLELPNVEADDVHLRAVPLSARASQEGRLKEFVIQCAAVRYKNLPFDNVTVRLLRPQINLPLYERTQSIELLSLDTLEVHATLRRDALLALASQKARWLKDPELMFDQDRIIASGKALGIPLRVEARLSVSDAALSTRLDRATVAGIPIPHILIGELTDRTVPLTVNRDQPYNLAIAPVAGDHDTLRIGR
jgi:hypothetical protein